MGPVVRWGIAWGPAATWAVVLFLLSEVRDVPLVAALAANDKVVHLILYGILGLLLGWGSATAPVSPPHWLVLAAGFAYGAVDEWHQTFVPRRIPSMSDFVADVIGVVLGYVLLLGLWRWARSSERRAERAEAL